MQFICFDNSVQRNAQLLLVLLLSIICYSKPPQKNHLLQLLMDNQIIVYFRYKIELVEKFQVEF